MKWLFFIAVILLFASCNSSEKDNTYVYTDEITGTLIADTIIYDVIIKDTNINDYWSTYCLKGVKQEEFVDAIFENIYNRKLTPLHFLNEEKFSIQEIEQMELESWFSREAVGKVQFTEVWYYNDLHAVMNKKVISLTLGIEQYDSSNKLKGYKPIFKVYLN